MRSVASGDRWKREGDGRGMTEERRSVVTRRARCDRAVAVWGHRHARAARAMFHRRRSLLDTGTRSGAGPGCPLHSIHEDRRWPTRHAGAWHRVCRRRSSPAEHHHARDTCRRPRARGAPRPATARPRLPAIGTNPRVALGRIYALPGEAPLPRSRLAPSLDVGGGRQRLTPTMRLTNGADHA